MNTPNSAAVLSIKKHPRFRWGRPAYGNRPIPQAGLSLDISNVLQPFTFEKVEKRYGSKLISLVTVHLRRHGGSSFLFIEIAVAKPAPPEKWLGQLKITVSDPIHGTTNLEVGKVCNRGDLRRTAGATSYEIIAKNDWLNGLEPHANATVTIESPWGKFRLTGNLRQLMNVSG